MVSPSAGQRYKFQRFYYSCRWKEQDSERFYVVAVQQFETSVTLVLSYIKLWMFLLNGIGVFLTLKT